MLKYTPPPRGPLFSRSVARPRGHRAKKAMVSTVFLGKQGKRVYTIGSGKKGTHHRASDPEEEKKGGLHGGGVYFFLRKVSTVFDVFEVFLGIFSKTKETKDGDRCDRIWRYHL